MKYKLILFFLGLLFLAIPRNVYAASYDMATTSNWNTRLDGEAAGVRLTGYNYYRAISVADINNNGKNDLIVGSPYSDNNSRSDSGSVYILLDDLLTSKITPGTIADMLSSSSYSLRIDGATAGDSLGEMINVGDLNGDQRPDLVLDSEYCYGYGSDEAGCVYILNNDLIKNYSGTGNTLDLNNPSNWSLRIDGQTDYDYLGYPNIDVADVIGSSVQDLVLSASYAGKNGRAYSGSVYVIESSLLNISTTGTTINLGNGSSYSIRYDGGVAGDYLGGRLFDATTVGDITGNGTADIAFTIDPTSFGRESIYIISDNLIRAYSGTTGNNLDLSSASNYLIRIHTGSDLSLLSKDINGDGKGDLIVGYPYNGSNAGSLYILFNSLISSYSGTGNETNFSDSTSYSLRIDGAAAGDYLGYLTQGAGDINGNGYDDLVVSAVTADNNSRADSGSVYVIYDSIISSYAGTGNSFSLSDSSKWSLRYDGATAGNDSADPGMLAYDLNNDGKSDLLFGVTTSDFNSRTSSGSLYILYNFPHSITQASSSRDGSTMMIHGLISASNSTTGISGIEYKKDNNSAASGWSSAGCTADDGGFNSRSEAFTCTIGGIPTSDGDHTIYLRAFDVNSSYTAQSQYLTNRYVIGGTSSATTKPQVTQDEGGVIKAFSENLSGKAPQAITAVLAPKTIHFDAFLSSSAESLTIASGVLPNPITGSAQTGRSNTILAGKILGVKTAKGVTWQVGDIQNVWLKAYAPGYQTANAAKIIPELQTKPSIIGISYDDNDLKPPGNPGKPFLAKNLKLAHSIDGITWKILTTSVVDPKNHTVAALHKIGGYYMIVGK